jgi:hypothetical protein
MCTNLMYSRWLIQFDTDDVLCSADAAVHYYYYYNENEDLIWLNSKRSELFKKVYSSDR